MSFVIDASVLIAWAFKEEHATAELTFARIQAEEAIAPALWWYELRNVLVLGARHGRLTERETARFLRESRKKWAISPLDARQLVVD